MRRTKSLQLEPVEVPIERLQLDSENPRVKALEIGDDQQEILKVLWREFSVDEIALSIAANGFFRYEPLFAVPYGNKKIVIEGNRRLAAALLLRDPKLRDKVGATDLPTINEHRRSELDTLPVLICERADVWQHLGFKHVNGPQAWNAESKADYIAWVHNRLKISLPDIAKTIGDKHRTVERLYHAMMVLKHAESAKQFDRDDRLKKHFSFSHLYTGLGYPGIQKFLALTEKDCLKETPVKKSHMKPLGELLGWIYGRKSSDREPLIQSQNPDLRQLDEVLQNQDGITALRRGMSLNVSLEIARGDERLFREAVQAAKQDLQKALGTLLTGYSGELELLNTAEEVEGLIKKLIEDMKQVSDRRGKQGKPRARS